MTAGDLAWGRRYLMCPPRHFGVLYEINPWMPSEVTVDPDQAESQWAHLAATLRAAGAEVVEMEPLPEVPDLVFTANAGLVNGDQFVPSHFRHPERQPETEVYAAWFAATGRRVDRLPDDLDHEGAGDALPFTPEGGRTCCCRATRSARTPGPPPPWPTCSAARCGRWSWSTPGCTTSTSPSARWTGAVRMVAPLGWDGYGRKVVEALVPAPLVLSDEEALSFCANSVVVGTTVVMPAAPPRVARRLEAWGFDVAECPVGEFLKAGGGCRCLTLALDVVLSVSPPATPTPPG